MLVHWFSGLSERVEITHGGATIGFDVTRREASYGSPLAFAWDRPGPFEVYRDGDWWYLGHGADAMRLRVWYPEEARESGHVRMVFQAARSWRITWAEHTGPEESGPRFRKSVGPAPTETIRFRMERVAEKTRGASDAPLRARVAQASVPRPGPSGKTGRARKFLASPGAKGLGDTEVAKALGVSRKTVWRARQELASAG